jgi:AAHS family 4-hydroxybenzoate transporter-like MFS transporter
MPLLLQSVGATLTTASIVASMFQIGGLVGALALGALMDRIDPLRVLSAGYALGALLVATVGVLPFSSLIFGCIVFGAGFCVVGCQAGLNAFAASLYALARLSRRNASG